MTPATKSPALTCKLQRRWTVAKRVSLRGRGADIFFGEYQADGAVAEDEPAPTPALSLPLTNTSPAPDPTSVEHAHGMVPERSLTAPEPAHPDEHTPVLQERK